MRNSPVEVTRAIYLAYVSKDRAAIEALTRTISTSPVRSTTASTAPHILNAAGRTAR